MNSNRVLNWDGCTNVRDLGGLSTLDGRKTRWGAVVRSDHPAKLTSEGWAALYAHGIRTIVTLYSEGMDEDKPDAAPRPADLTTVSIAIEDFNDTEFMQKWFIPADLWCTPLYYREALTRWPERHIAVVQAVARAQPGGVLIHCGRGKDRSGIISVLLLAIAGVTPDEIIADYELSPDSYREEILTREQTTARESLLATLAWLDVDNYLLTNGLSQADLDAVRTRLLLADT